MIRALICRTKEGDICQFEISGHAEYSEAGTDIVCAAVSVLVINTINCLERFTNVSFTCEASEDGSGRIACSFPEVERQNIDHDSQLLLQAMAFGLKDIEDKYGNYIKVHDREVQ